jgi:hypothetical protein
MDRAGDNLYADVAGGLLDEGTDDAHALAVVENQRPRLERFSVLMSAIITGAPMFGILGTVLGIIDSFGVLGGEDTLADPRLVSNGISEALIATATGLVVALVTLFWGASAVDAATFFAAVLASMVVAAVAGGAIPLVLHAVRLNPNLAAGPIALVIADTATLAIYFTLGLLILMPGAGS